MAWHHPGDKPLLYLNQWWLVYWWIYVSLSLNELRGPNMFLLYKRPKILFLSDHITKSMGAENNCAPLCSEVLWHSVTWENFLRNSQDMNDWNQFKNNTFSYDDYQLSHTYWFLSQSHALPLSVLSSILYYRQISNIQDETINISVWRFDVTYVRDLTVVSYYTWYDVREMMVMSEPVYEAMVPRGGHVCAGTDSATQDAALLFNTLRPRPNGCRF